MQLPQAKSCLCVNHQKCIVFEWKTQDDHMNYYLRGREQKPATVECAEPLFKVPEAGVGLNRFCSIHDIVPPVSRAL